MFFYQEDRNLQELMIKKIQDLEILMRHFLEMGIAHQSKLNKINEELIKTNESLNKISKISENIPEKSISQKKVIKKRGSYKKNKNGEVDAG